MGTLGKRLAGLDKIAAASDAWQELRTSMEAVEGRFGTQTLDVANRIADAFSERLGKTEAGLQRLQEETERHWSSNGERQIALEASVRAHLQGAEEAGKTHARDLLVASMLAAPALRRRLWKNPTVPKRVRHYTFLGPNISRAIGQNEGRVKSTCGVNVWCGVSCRRYSGVPSSRSA